MRPARPFHRILAPAAALALALAGCEQPGEGDVLSIEAVGAVGAVLVLDANGTGRADQGDLPLAGWTVNLDQPAGGTVASAVTDEEGAAVFLEVPVGRLVPSVPANALGDTLSLIPATALPFTLGASQTASLAPVVTLPTYSVGQARELPAGKPLFTEGIALNGLGTTDRVLHLKAGDRYIRVLSVDEGSVAVGDSVRVAGRTAVDQGVPVLDGQAVFRLRAGGPQPVPLQLSTGEAAGARGGELDAALVFVTGAEIKEVVDQGEEGVLLVADDGNGPVTIRFRSSFQVDPEAIEPDTDFLAVAVGLLVPGRLGTEVVWEIRPRTTSDVLIGRLGG